MATAPRVERVLADLQRKRSLADEPGHRHEAQTRHQGGMTFGQCECMAMLGGRLDEDGRPWNGEGNATEHWFLNWKTGTDRKQLQEVSA